MFTLAGHAQMLHCPSRPLPTHRNSKSDPELAPNCPRCASANTKFCYYNNYSLSQPRYFCKSCRRYWTKGGSLRNVPVGGGCRKSRRGRVNRAAQSSRVSLNCGKNLSSRCPDNPEETFGDPNSDDSAKGPDIDLAVVFANFFNPLNNQESASSLEFSSNSQKDAVTDSATRFEGESLEELLEADELSELGLQSLLNDDVVRDALWSEAGAVPGLSSEIEERFDSLPEDDRNFQKKSSGNFEIDGWSWFDLSGLI